MKRIWIAGIIPVFLLFACTGENNKNVETVPTSTTESQPNDTTTQTETVNEKENEENNVLTNTEEAFVFLEKAAEITSKLETVRFSTYYTSTSYKNNVDEPGYYDEYNSTYDGIMQRDPKLAFIMSTTENRSGVLINGYKDQYDDSSLAAYTKTEYFDPELGWFSEFAHYSYENVVENDEQEQPIITHNDIEDGFQTLEQIDALIQLFMSYSDQLEIYKDSYEDVELDNWIIELKLTNEQYAEHYNMLDSNLFTGGYFNVDLNEQTIPSESLKDFYVALMFDPSYNPVQLTVNYTQNASPDYDVFDYFTIHYYTFFSDYNVPYTYSIPENVLLNADYN